MGTNIRDLLEDWPTNFIKDDDLAILLDKTDDARYSIVKRALKAGLLVRVRRGLYLIAIVPLFVEDFELALPIYGPSFVSLESALSYHGWIPEAVYTTTCVSTKRAKEFNTPFGIFSYKRVPEERFYAGVDRIETKKGAFFVATSWRAIADFIYTKRKSWKTIGELEEDLRIDRETLIKSDKEMLKLLAKYYPSHRVRENLNKFLKEITKNLQEDLTHKPSGLIGISDEQINDHWKLYEGYVKQVDTLEGSANRHRYGFEYNGMVLHEYYFENLKAGGEELVDGPLKDAITKTWGSVEAWKEDFVKTGKSRGVGWAILYASPEGNLTNNFVIGHDCGHIAGYKPILVMDVWEHAYMVDHNAGGRGDYIEGFMKNINWKVAEKRF